MALRSFAYGYVTGILTKDQLVKCLILVCSYFTVFSSKFTFPYADEVFRVVVAFIPEIIGISLVLGFILVYYASLYFLNWLQKISSPKVFKLFLIILIALMVYLEYKVIHNAYLFFITLENAILRLAIQSWIAFIILFTIWSIYYALVLFGTDLRVPIPIPNPTVSRSIVSLFVVTFLIICYTLLNGLKGQYWAIAYFPHFLGLIYLSFVFPNAIFASTTLFWYVMLFYSIVPHDILIKLRLKHEPLLLSEKIFIVCFQFLFEAFTIALGWLCLVWIWLEGNLLKALAEMVTLLFLVDD